MTIRATHVAFLKFLLYAVPRIFRDPATDVEIFDASNVIELEYDWITLSAIYACFVGKIFDEPLPVGAPPAGLTAALVLLITLFVL